MERLPVRTPARQIVPLRFNAAQEHLWRIVAPLLDARQPVKMIVLKARREGVSTFTEALLTVACVLHDYTQALVVAHQARPTQRIWEMSERFVQGSPLRAIAGFKGHTIRFRQSVLECATAGSPEAARSADITCFHGSEVAFWKDPNAMLAIRQCLPQDEEAFSIEIDESTANGMVDEGALFYNEWQAATTGDNGFTTVFLPWHTFPNYTSRLQIPLDDLDPEEAILVKDLHLTPGQLRWRRTTLADRCQGDVEKFNQEYPATPEMAFIISGLPFFSTRELLWLEPHIRPGRRGKLLEIGGRVRFQDEAKGRLQVFVAPQPGHEYAIGADSAMGHDDRSHSRSAAEVIDMATFEQVAEYEAAAPPHVFAKDLSFLGRAYNEALLMPEVQSSGGGGGREVVVYLRDEWNYPNIGVWRGANDRIRSPNPILYGWETSSRTKPMMLARLQQVVLDRSLLVHSRALLTQLRTYGEKDSGAFEALSGHDDLLMAMGIAIMARFQNWLPKVSQASQVLQMPFDAAHLEHQQDIHDRDAQMLATVMGSLGETLGVGSVPREFMEW